MVEFKINWLPASIYTEIFWWLHNMDIGDMRKVVEETEGYPEIVTMSEEEAALFILRWA